MTEVPPFSFPRAQRRCSDPRTAQPPLVRRARHEARRGSGGRAVRPGPRGGMRHGMAPEMSFPVRRPKVDRIRFSSGFASRTRSLDAALPPVSVERGLRGGAVGACGSGGLGGRGCSVVSNRHGRREHERWRLRDLSNRPLRLGGRESPQGRLEDAVRYRRGDAELADWSLLRVPGGVPGERQSWGNSPSRSARNWHSPGAGPAHDRSTSLNAGPAAERDAGPAPDLDGARFAARIEGVGHLRPAKYQAKYPKAVTCLTKDREALLGSTPPGGALERPRTPSRDGFEGRTVPSPTSGAGDGKLVTAASKTCRYEQLPGGHPGRQIRPRHSGRRNRNPRRRLIMPSPTFTIAPLSHFPPGHAGSEQSSLPLVFCARQYATTRKIAQTAWNADLRSAPRRVAPRTA